MARPDTTERDRCQRGDRAGDSDQRPRPPEVVDRSGGPEDGDQRSDPQGGADLAKGVVDGAAGGEARSRQLGDGGAPEGGEGETDARAGEQRGGQEVRGVRTFDADSQLEEERAGAEDEPARDGSRRSSLQGPARPFAPQGRVRK